MKDNNDLKNSRQLQLLDKYYPVNFQTKEVTFQLSYDTTSNLLMPHIKPDLSYPIIHHNLIEEMGKFLKMIPPDYHAIFEFRIKDYQSYDPKILMNALNDSMELNHYSGFKEKNRNFFLAIVMTVIGILVLLFMGVGEVNNWFDGNYRDLIVEVIDILGTVFIWEAIGLAFLQPSEKVELDIRIRNKISKITFFDDQNNVLCEETKAEMLKKWVNETILKKVGYRLLLITGSAMIAAGFGSLLVNISTLFTAEGDILSTVILLTSYLIASVINFLAGGFAIAFYVGRKDRRVGLTVMVILSAISLVAEIISLIIDPSQVHTWISLFFDFAITGGYVVGYLMIFANRKIEKKAEETKE